MDEDDLGRYSDKPFEEGHDWQRLRRTIHRTDSAWGVLAPFVALKDNWKALAVVAALIVFFSSPEIIAAIRTIAGVVQ